MRSVDSLRLAAGRGTLDAPLARRLQPWLAHVLANQDWLRALDGERVLFGTYAWAGLRQGLPPNGVVHPKDPLGLLYSKLLRPWRLLEEQKYFAVLDQQRKTLSEHPWEFSRGPEIHPLFQISRLLTCRNLKGLLHLHVRHGRDLAEIALRLAIARGESGDYPSTLDALGDLPREPVSGQPYSFTRVGAGYSLALPAGAAVAGDAAAWTVPR